MKRRIFILPLIALLISSCEIKAKNSNIVSDSTASVPPTSASNEPSSVGETSLGTSIINPPSESASENSDNINSSNTEIPKVIRLQYSGTGSNKKFNEQLFDDFRLARKTTGDPNTYEIEYLEIGPDRIDNEILDWEVGPDVYEFNTDKLPKLYEKGALSKIVNSNAAFIEENNNDYGKDLAKLNGNYYAYPYAIDTSYYVQYDKSFFSAEDVKSIETMLDKAEAAGKKVGYNLQEAYWSGGSMFTFGADYQMTFDEDGAVTNVTADFNTEKG
ncbi:MAG: extracellular solute-binding protein, partial [Erysipelotrichales bacterium]|nr:extracellular solute-binding protein [Erysipelotrichales bacterium]